MTLYVAAEIARLQAYCKVRRGLKQLARRWTSCWQSYVLLIGSCGQVGCNQEPRNPVPTKRYVNQASEEPQDDESESVAVKLGPSPVLAHFVPEVLGLSDKSGVVGARLLVARAGQPIVVGIRSDQITAEPPAGETNKHSMMLASLDGVVPGNVISVPVRREVDVHGSEPIRITGAVVTSMNRIIVGGELEMSSIGESQIYATETQGADRTIFVAEFGPRLAVMARSFRLGISGHNSLAGMAQRQDEKTVWLAGYSDGGLLPGSLVPRGEGYDAKGNFLAEFSTTGQIQRFYSWSEALPDGTREVLLGISSMGPTLFVAAIRNNQFVIKSFHSDSSGRRIVPLGERPTRCQGNFEGKVLPKISMDATPTELLVTVEMDDSVVGSGFVIPCLEIFPIRKNGQISASREHVRLAAFPAVKGTSVARIIDGGKVVVARSREAFVDTVRRDAPALVILARPLTSGNYKPLALPPIEDPGTGTDTVMNHGASIVRDLIVDRRGGADQPFLWVLADQVKSTSDPQRTFPFMMGLPAVSPPD